MIIGFLGKGGSGKSTLSSQFALYLIGQKKRVLAIDADHNMDMLYNLGIEQEIAYLGDALPDLLDYCGLDPKTQKYSDAFFLEKEPRFALSPADSFSHKYAQKISGNLRVMAGGPHTDNVLYGEYCSHSLGTPLKVYLPYLQLQEDEYVVLDEKAGSDGAGTGISSGLDFAFVVLEPTRHGTKAARQIAELLNFYRTPYALVLNKVFSPDDKVRVKKEFDLDVITSFPFSQEAASTPGTAVEGFMGQMSELLIHAASRNKKDRKERSIEKFVRNKEFKKSHAEKA